MDNVFVDAIAQVGPRIGGFLDEADRSRLMMAHPLFKDVHANIVVHVFTNPSAHQVRAIKRLKPNLRFCRVELNVDDHAFLDELASAFASVECEIRVGRQLTTPLAARSFAGWLRGQDLDRLRRWSVHLSVWNSDVIVPSEEIMDLGIRISTLECYTDFLSAITPRSVDCAWFYGSWDGRSRTDAPAGECLIKATEVRYSFDDASFLTKDLVVARKATILYDTSREDPISYIGMLGAFDRLRKVVFSDRCMIDPKILVRMLHSLTVHPVKGAKIEFRKKAVEDPNVVTLVECAVRSYYEGSTEARTLSCGCMAARLVISETGSTPQQKICAILASYHLRHLSTYVDLPHIASDSETCSRAWNCPYTYDELMLKLHNMGGIAPFWERLGPPSSSPTTIIANKQRQTTMSDGGIRGAAFPASR